MTIRIAFQSTWEALKDMWDEMFILIFCNILWALTFIPLAMAYAIYTTMRLSGIIVLVTLVAITVVLQSLVNGGLFYMTHKIAEGRAVSFGDFKDGLRQYRRKSIAMGFTFSIVLLILVANLYFYGRFDGVIYRILQILFLYLVAIWTLMQLYVFPLLIEQEEDSLRLALRNASVLVLRHPDFSIAIGIVALILIAISVALTIPAIILLGSVLALLGNRAVVNLLALYRDAEVTDPEDPGWQLDKNDTDAGTT